MNKTCIKKLYRISSKDFTITVIFTLVNVIIFNAFFKTIFETALVSISLSYIPKKIYILYKEKQNLTNKKNIYLKFLQELSSLLTASYSCQNSLEIICNNLLNNPLILKNDKKEINKIRELIKNKRSLNEIIPLFFKIFPVDEAQTFFHILKDNYLPHKEIISLVRRNEESLRTSINEELNIESENSRQRSESLIMIVLPCIIINFLKFSNPSFFMSAYNLTLSRLTLAFSCSLMIAAIFITNKIIFFSNVKNNSNKVSHKRNTILKNKILKCRLEYVSDKIKKTFKLILESIYSYLDNWKNNKAREQNKMYREVLGELFYPINNEHIARKNYTSISSKLNLINLYTSKQLYEIKNDLSSLDQYLTQKHPISISFYFSIKNKIFLSCLLISIFFIFINKSLFVILLILTFLSPLLQDLDLKSKKNEYIDNFIYDFPEAINLLSIYLNMDFSFINALKSSCLILKDNCVCHKFKRIIDLHYFGINEGILIRENLSFSKNNIVDRACTALIHFIEDGDKESLQKLNNTTLDAYELLSTQKRKRLTKKQLQLLIPMSLSLLSIILISIAPLLDLFLSL